MVATISRIRDAITSLFSHSNKIPFHKRHINNKYKSQVHKTRVHSCKPANVARIFQMPQITHSLLEPKQIITIENSFLALIATQITCSNLTPHLHRESSPKILIAI